TLVDRKSRYTIILRLRGKDSVSVNQALTDKFLSLPSELRKSLTWDRGMELARHLEFTVSTGVKVYFCDPQSPWQRGTNENTNGLIRQYFPKKTCLAQYRGLRANDVKNHVNRLTYCFILIIRCCIYSYSNDHGADGRWNAIPSRLIA
ncbi:IS30 family transposase, partial [Escherichia coli]